MEAQDLGSPIPLFSIDKKKKFVFNEEEIRAVFLQDEIMDRTPVIVSVAGDFRTGKSFLLNFFLRYINFTYKSPNKERTSWMEDENVSLEGFVWKCTKNRVTTGIDIWSKPVCTTLPSGEKVAIFLLDTQGLNDSKTLFEVNVKVFALSTLLSSVQVYNLKQQIQEDNLQMLKIFTDYGDSVSSNTENSFGTPFQKLLFLVRDWSYPHDNAYGFEGGQQVVEEILQINDEEGDYEELNSVRRDLKSCFTAVEGFLMPDPGKQVKEDPSFSGQLSGISKEFQNSLEELVPHLLGPQNLLPKKINGQTVKVLNLFVHLCGYVNMMNSAEKLTPKSIIYANAQSSRLQAFQAAIEECKICLDSVFEDVSKPYVEKDEIAEKDVVLDIASQKYKNYPKLCKDDAVEKMMLDRLRGNVEELYDSYLERNENKRKLHIQKIELERQHKENVKRQREHEETLRQMEEIRKNDAENRKKMKLLEEQSKKQMQYDKELREELRLQQERVAELQRDIDQNRRITRIITGAVLGAATLAAGPMVLARSVVTQVVTAVAGALTGAAGAAGLDDAMKDESNEKNSNNGKKDPTSKRSS